MESCPAQVIERRRAGGVVHLDLPQFHAGSAVKLTPRVPGLFRDLFPCILKQHAENPYTTKTLNDNGCRAL